MVLVYWQQNYFTWPVKFNSITTYICTETLPQQCTCVHMICVCVRACVWDHPERFRNIKCVFACFLMCLHCYGPCSRTLSPRKTRTRISCIVQNISADGLAKQGLRTSAIVVLTSVLKWLKSRHLDAIKSKSSLFYSCRIFGILVLDKPITTFCEIYL